MLPVKKTEEFQEYEKIKNQRQRSEKSWYKI